MAVPVFLRDAITKKAYKFLFIKDKLRVSSVPYLFDIAEGNVLGHYALNKFGFNADLATSYEDVWDGSAVYTYTTTAAEMHCSSSNAGDTQEIEVEGLDGGWHPQTVRQVLAGQTETTIGTNKTWMRVFRVTNTGATDFAGTVYIYEDDTVTAGVPQTPAKIRAQVTIGYNQTLMALWTVPMGMTAFMHDIYASTSAAKLVTVALFIRPPGGVFQVKHLEEFATDRFEHKFDLPLTVESQSDIAMRAKVTVAGGDVVAGFDLWYEE